MPLSKARKEALAAMLPFTANSGRTAVNIRHPQYTDNEYTVYKPKKSTAYSTTSILIAAFFSDVPIHVKGPDLIRFADKLPFSHEISKRTANPLLQKLREKGGKERLRSLGFDQTVRAPKQTVLKRKGGILNAVKEEIERRRLQYRIECLENGRTGMDMEVI